MSYRNAVLTGLLDRLSKDFNLRIVVGPGQDALRTAVTRPGWEVVSLPRVPIDFIRSKWVGLLETAQYLRFYELHPNSTMEKFVQRIHGQRDLKTRLSKGLAVLSRFTAPKGSFPSRSYLAFAQKRLNKVLDQVDGLLLLTTDVTWDKSLAVAAKQKGIPLTQLVHSWDNLPARGFLMEKPDRLLVWNATMSQQALEMHDVPPQNTRIVGVPQYDRYRQIASTIDRIEFFNRYGISQNGAITYTCSAERIFPDEVQFVELLYSLAKAHGRTLVVRAHPTERRDVYKQLMSQLPGVILSMPDSTFAASEHVSTLDDSESIKEFVGLMRFSDIVINLASTISLDASLFGTPVICPRFNMDPQLNDKWNAAFRWYDSEHFGPIARSGGIHICDSPESLNEKIESLLKSNYQNSIVAQAQRKLIEYFAPYRGETSERIAEAIREVVKDL